MIRRRGTAIIETSKGILVGKEKTDRRYALIGGNAKRGESRTDAAIRETDEETGLDVILSKPLFEFQTQNNLGTTLHRAVLIKAEGILHLIKGQGASRDRYGNWLTAYSPSNELICLGFFNFKTNSGVDTLKNPDTSRYQGHIYACLKKYLASYRNKNLSKYFSNDVSFK